ncbi:NADP-dependent oxidoreductase [Kutzneria albida]|uniref:Putative NADP-dependent oxidoreductase yfmJ n=1 Tax=Kutzneria albida DSM 43870 TaxID=1449976 RepID=W5VYL8_9PSEU|nr:NADP-dependent oxidoreductase [Kutzneria albida]AHH94013.1 Putative NADP-dependent oxidoreductase yfmJ [Kutzneria albida DSM 43870]
MAVQSSEIRLAARPHGWPTAETFTLAEVSLPDPEPGQLVVRNLFMSVDPYMRGRMNDVKSYVPPFQVGKALEGGAVGEVVTSTVEEFKPGDVVLHGLGWRDTAVVAAKHVVKVDPDLAPLGAYLGVLGMPGLTAYAGLLEVAEFKPGDVVFVSGAAGAVGQIVGQLAKLKGAAKVIGSAGSAEKVAYLTEELGFDAAFNYKDGPVLEQLQAAAPEGIDVYFDNVGGEHLEAAIATLNVHGRVAVCGMISVYNATEATPAPRNLPLIIAKRLTIRGLLVSDHSHLKDEFVADVAPLIASGQLRYSETVVDGLANAPEAFLGMLRGENTGKMLVKINER